MDMSRILTKAAEMNASDVHFTVGQPVFFRVAGEIFKFGENLTADEVKNFLTEILPEHGKSELKEKGGTDFSYTEKNLNRRFRVNVYRQRNFPAAAFRLIADKIPTLEEIGAPAVLKKLLDLKQGLILVTGRTGSGKSTTIAAFLNELCSLGPRHLLTLEDPIEFEYSTEKSFVSQREYGQDFFCFADAVRTAMREMPDVLLIGEIRDSETMSAALEASAAGILVLSTLHTRSAAETAMRVETMFPISRRESVRDLFADEFSAIISQELVKNSAGKIVCSAEVLTAIPATRSIIRAGKYIQLPSIMLANRSCGMQIRENKK